MLFYVIPYNEFTIQVRYLLPGELKYLFTILYYEIKLAFMSNIEMVIARKRKVSTAILLNFGYVVGGGETTKCFDKKKMIPYIYYNLRVWLDWKYVWREENTTCHITFTSIQDIKNEIVYAFAQNCHPNSGKAWLD